MPAGALAYVITCVPAGQGGKSMSTTTNPCQPQGGATLYPKTVQAYVLDPAAQAYIDPIAEPFDYVAAGAIFTFFFSWVVGIWFFSKNIGSIVEAVKRF